MVYTIFRKEITVFLSDRKAVFLAFFMPVVLITLFTFAFGDIGDNTRKMAINIPIVAADTTGKAGDFLRALAGDDDISFEFTEQTEALYQIRTGERPGALILGEGFNDSVRSGTTIPLEFVYDEAKAVQVGAIQQSMVNAYFQTLGVEHTKVSITKGIRQSNPLISPMILMGINRQIEEQYGSLTQSDESSMLGGNIKLTKFGKKRNIPLGLVQAVSGVAVLMLLFTVIIMGVSIIDERESGTLKRLLIAPMQPGAILVGKMSAMVAISIVQLAVMFVFAWLVFGLPLFRDVPGLLLMMVSTAVACTGFGIFLASIVTTKRQAESVAIISILVVSALGGSMIPLYIMPEFMQKIAVVSLNYWAIQGYFDIFWRELPFWVVLGKVAVLMAIGTGFTALAYWQFNRRMFRMV